MESPSFAPVHRSSFGPPLRRKGGLVGLTLLGLLAAPALALQVTGYSSETNDRFSAGYPTAPVENASPNFVGAGLNWSGVGWSSADASKSFGFLSPRHYLVASHYAGSASVSIFANGSVQSQSQWKVENTGYGAIYNGTPDLSLGTLNEPFSGNSGMARYAVLDLNSTSGTNDTSAYNNLSLLLYGKGPNSSSSTRIGEASISVVINNQDGQYFLTGRTTTQLEGGDSGSPAVHRWTNPAGVQEVTVVGNHLGINETYNFVNFAGTYQAMAALNTLMNDDGFALRVVGNPTKTWVGSSSTSITNAGAWGLGGPGPPQSAPSDQFVNFNGATAGNNRVVSVNSNHNLRGLYFLPTNSGSLGFSFQGSSTLTIGRGGITNYDTSRQTFTAPLALGSSQMWNGGAGGITTAGINTNGNLLEITTQGETRITGAITGTGSLALSGGTLEMGAASSYSGRTWVHSGTLVATNASGSATGTGNVSVAAGATLAGTGTISGAVTVSGRVAPGTNGIGTLSTGAVTWNSGNAWQFNLSTSDGTSDRLAITGAFTKGSGGSSSFVFDFMGISPKWGETFTLVTFSSLAGGFAAGDVTPFSYTGLGPGSYSNSSFTLTGSSLTFTAIPEPTTTLGGLLLVAGLLGRRRKDEG